MISSFSKKRSNAPSKISDIESNFPYFELADLPESGSEPSLFVFYFFNGKKKVYYRRFPGVPEIALALFALKSRTKRESADELITSAHPSRLLAVADMMLIPDKPISASSDATQMRFRTAETVKAVCDFTGIECSVDTSNENYDLSLLFDDNVFGSVVFCGAMMFRRLSVLHGYNFTCGCLIFKTATAGDVSKHRFFPVFRLDAEVKLRSLEDAQNFAEISAIRYICDRRNMFFENSCQPIGNGKKLQTFV